MNKQNKFTEQDIFIKDLDWKASSWLGNFFQTFLFSVQHYNWEYLLLVCNDYKKMEH